MRHKKIFKREDGSRVMIQVSLFIDRFIENGFRYDKSIWVCAPKKRTWTNVINSDDYQWRAMSLEQKDKFKNNAQLLYASEEELHSAEIELWKKIKP